MTPTAYTIEPMVTLDAKAKFSERLNDALDQCDIVKKGHGRQTAVAKMFRVSQKGARKWLEGEAIPNTKRLPEIAIRLETTTEWLLTGRNPASPPSATLGGPPLDAMMTKITPRSREALKRIAKAADDGLLSDPDMELLHRIAERLSAKK